MSLELTPSYVKCCHLGMSLHVIEPVAGMIKGEGGSPNLKVLPLHQFWGDGKEERIFFLPLSSFPPEAKHRARSGACGQPASLVPIVGRSRKARIYSGGERVKNSNVQRGCQILIPLVQIVGTTTYPLQENKCVFVLCAFHFVRAPGPESHTHCMSAAFGISNLHFNFLPHISSVNNKRLLFGHYHRHRCERVTKIDEGNDKQTVRNIDLSDECIWVIYCQSFQPFLI